MIHTNVHAFSNVLPKANVHSLLFPHRYGGYIVSKSQWEEVETRWETQKSQRRRPPEAHPLQAQRDNEKQGEDENWNLEAQEAQGL